MSQLIDKFHKALQAANPPLGFLSTRASQPAPKLILIASITADAEELSALGTADAILLRTAQAVELAKKIASSLPSTPWGLYLEDANPEKDASATGADFIIFPASAEVSAISTDERTGRIIEVEASMDDGLLRAVNYLPVDAVLVASTFANGNTLVWHQLMIFQHLSNLIAKPLIIPAPATIGTKELKAIWDAGIDSIIVEIDAASAANLSRLRQAINELPSRSGRKGGKIEARIPRTFIQETKLAPPDEEEEEEP